MTSRQTDSQTTQDFCRVARIYAPGARDADGLRNGGDLAGLTSCRLSTVCFLCIALRRSVEATIPAMTPTHRRPPPPPGVALQTRTCLTGTNTQQIHGVSFRENSQKLSKAFWLSFRRQSLRLKPPLTLTLSFNASNPNPGNPKRPMNR